MYRYNGSSWDEHQRVFVGEATTDGSSVTSVTTYALRGYYSSGRFAVASANATYTKSHNLGVEPGVKFLMGAEVAGGVLYDFANVWSAGFYGIWVGSYDYKSAQVIIGNSQGEIRKVPGDTSIAAVEVVLIVKRGW